MFLPLFDQNPTRSRPVVTYGLLAANLVVWALQLWGSAGGEGDVLQTYGVVPARFLVDPWGALPTLCTSMFMHGSWAHLFGNLLFLHIFGDNVEDALGRGRFLAFYLGSGVVAGLAEVWVEPSSWVPMVGASGAIAGVLGAYLVLFPRSPIFVLNSFLLPWPILVFPAWLAIGMWFVLNLVGGVASLGMGHGGGVAYFAHLGGFLAGLLAIRGCMFGRVCPELARWEGWRPLPRHERRIPAHGALPDPWRPPGGARR